MLVNHSSSSCFCESRTFVLHQVELKFCSVVKHPHIAPTNFHSLFDVPVTDFSNRCIA